MNIKWLIDQESNKLKRLSGSSVGSTLGNFFKTFFPVKTKGVEFCLESAVKPITFLVKFSHL